MCLQYIHTRHGRVLKQIGQYRTFDQYQGGTINLLGGAARTEEEVTQFIQVVKIYNPETAVLMTPIGVEVDPELWDQYGLVGSTKFGDVVG